MIFGNRVLAESYVTFRARKIRIFLTTINFEIKRAAVINRRGDMTSVRAATRTYRHFKSLRIDRTERRARGIVTVQTTQIRMLTALVTKRAGGNSPAPAIAHHLIGAHQRRQLWIKIDFQL